MIWTAYDDGWTYRCKGWLVDLGDWYEPPKTEWSLWHGSEHLGKFASAELAKAQAELLQAARTSEDLLNVKSEVLDVLSDTAHETGLKASPACEKLVDALVARMCEPHVLERLARLSSG